MGMPNIYNQTEAAEYISEQGLKMTASWLSKLTTMDLGPKHQRKGNVKLFYEHDLDIWVEAELAKKARRDSEK